MAKMQSTLSVYPLRLTPGMELNSTLLHFVKENKLNAAFIMTCCGSLTKATLRMAKNLEGRERIKTFEEYFEILSLSGTLSGDTGHLHISLGDKEGRVIGGHVVGDLIIYTTAEVVIGNCNDVSFTRSHDQATGFPELDIAKP